jgi:2-dehydro-3-deoxyphosphogluconate aldolase/(4S)-4-hydroxy-2-oxoglutarate aldolase
LSSSVRSRERRDAAGAGDLLSLVADVPVIPVLTIDRLADAVPLAQALVAGGLRLLEITLRTECAVDAMAAIAGEVEGALVGAGTVLRVEQLHAVRRAGAHFAVSPGATPRLLDAAPDGGVPLLPGAATASEVMGLLERGYRFMKFFPAVPAGGVPFLKSLAAPLPEARFCPTGGITAETAPAFLALANVACVGGSWMVPADAVRAGDWGKIAELARTAAGLRPVTQLGGG